jgi:cyanophycinase
MKAPRGKLIIIGGSEHKGIPDDKNKDRQESNPDFMEQEILRRIIDESCATKSTIEVIPTASRIPEEVGDDYRKAFGKLECEQAHILDIRTREDASDKKVLKRLGKASAIMLSGGDQMRLSTILGGTPALEIIQERYMKEDFVIAGTSAGAMVMSNSMIIQGSSEEAFFKGELRITSGFSFIGGVIIDTHFIKRGRFGRLAQAVAINPSCIGIGLEEDTAVVVTKGEYMEAIGSGNVIIIDGHTIKGSNIMDADEGAPISINNMTVHVMAKGDCYDLEKREFLEKKNE